MTIFVEIDWELDELEDVLIWMSERLVVLFVLFMLVLLLERSRSSERDCCS